MYQVPASRSSVVQFVMTCPGMSHSSTFTLHMRDNGQVDDGKVWGDLCREKRVNIAYNNYRWIFGVNEETGEMVRWRWGPGEFDSEKAYIPRDFEILDSFFRNHDIVPFWINCHYDWGRYDEALDKWTGAVGKVREKANLFLSVYMVFSDRS